MLILKPKTIVGVAGRSGGRMDIKTCENTSSSMCLMQILK